MLNILYLLLQSQLIRCAPHHVRADVKNTGHILDDVQKALNTVRSLKSRGVTRFYDLHRLNRQELMDAEVDEHTQSTDGELMDDSDHEMSPPRQRPRLLPPAPVTTAMPDESMEESADPG